MRKYSRKRDRDYRQMSFDDIIDLFTPETHLT